MTMKATNLSAAWGLAVFVLLVPTTSASAQNAEPPQSEASAQVVSQTGILPVYGVDIKIDPSWVDDKAFPSTSSEFPNQGIAAPLQQLWDTLKPTGFNCVRFPIDVANAKPWATRTANLCLWASANGIRLIPVLTGASSSGYSSKAAEFIKALAGTMLADTQYGPAYSQILCLQIGDRINHAGVQSSGSSDALAKTLVSAASAVRTAEQQALKDSGVYATPIMADISFDYELIKAKSMGGATLTDAAFEEACQSARLFLAQVVTAPDVDIVNLRWFPGSMGAGSVHKLADLPRTLKPDLAGKQFSLTTGFSTGVQPPADQGAYYTAAFTNAVQYRAQEASDGTFLGMFFYEAVGSAPPSDDTASKTSGWDWAAKAGELASMWSGGAKSDELASWVTGSEAGMGMLYGNKDESGAWSFASLPGYDALVQVASAVEQANTEVATQPETYTDSGAAAAPTGDGSSASGSSFTSKIKEGLMGLVDKVFQKIGDQITAPSSGSMGGGSDWSSPSGAPADTWTTGTDSAAVDTSGTTSAVSIGLSDADVSFTPPAPAVGQTLTANVNIHNQSTDAEATGLSVAVVDSEGYVVDAGAQQSGVSIPAGGTQKVSLSWTPSQPGTMTLSTEVYDSAFGKVASAQKSITVSGSPSEEAPSDSAIGLQLTKANVSIVPASPKAQSPTKVRVTLQNKGAADLAGIDLLLLDANADPSSSLLGEVNGNSVTKGGQKQIDINWTPDASGSYNLAVQAWQGFSEMLTETSLDPVNVAEAGSPGDSPTPGGALSIASVTVAPASPKTGQQTTFKVKLSNDSQSAVSDLDAFLIDQAEMGAAYDQESVPTIAKGAQKNIDLSWEPAAEGSYSLEVQVWDSGGLLVSKPVDVVVSAGSGGGGVPGGSGAVDAGRLKIPSKIKISKPLPEPPGGVIGSLITKLPPGLPEVRELAMGSAGPAPGAPKPIKMSLANTYPTAITDLKVALLMNGKQLATRSLGTLIPGQTRSLEFGGLPPLDPGKHRIQVQLSGNAGKPLSGTVESDLTISTRMLATTGALASGTVLRPKVGLIPLPTKTGSSAVRTVLPPAFNVGGRQLVVPSASAVPALAAGAPQPRSVLPAATAAQASLPKTTTRSTTTPPTQPATTPTAGIPGVRTPTATTPTTVRPTIGTTPTATTKTPSTIPGVTTTPQPTVLRPTTPTIPGVSTPTVPKTGATTPPTPTTPLPTVRPTTPTVVVPTPTSTAPPLEKAPTLPTTTVPTTVRPTTTPTVVAPTTPTVAPPPTTVVKPTVTAPTTVQPTVTSTARVTTLVAKPDLAVSSGDIKFSPSSPKVREQISFAVTVRNLTAAQAESAKVVMVLYADGSRLTQKDSTITVAANGVRVEQWQVATPKAKQLMLEVVVTHSADSVSTNNRATAVVAVAQ